MVLSEQGIWEDQRDIIKPENYGRLVTIRRGLGWQRRSGDWLKIVIIAQAYVVYEKIIRNLNVKKDSYRLVKDDIKREHIIGKVIGLLTITSAMDVNFDNGPTKTKMEVSVIEQVRPIPIKSEQDDSSVPSMSISS